MNRDESLPRITVVTPSYNQGQYLEETIQSVLRQGYPNLEYIIIDGGSSDNSVDIIKKYEGQLAFWVSEPDRGFGDAINKGFRRATGSILCWLNSDDLLQPGALTIVGTYFKHNPTVGVVYGDRFVINEQSIMIAQRCFYFYMPGQFKYGRSIGQESTFWRREIFIRAGEINENLQFAIDFDLWCRLSKIAPVRHLPFFLGAFRKQTASKTANIRQKGVEETIWSIKENYDQYPNRIERLLFNVSFAILKKLYFIFGIHTLKRKYYLKRLMIGDMY
jgi:glycosyltransferase involved in cell wall biosynthesis